MRTKYLPYNHWNEFTSTLVQTIALSLMLTLLFSSPTLAQDLSKSRLSLSCTQLPKSEMYLEAKLLGRVEKRNLPLNNSEILFYLTESEDRRLLGKAKTSKNGICRIQIENTASWLVSQDGVLLLSAEYLGNSKFKSGDDEIEIKRATIDYKAISDEEGNRISITAASSDSTRAPLAEYEILMSVPRMYSDLIVSEDFTDEEGRVEFIFPEGIPGDNAGNLDLKIRIVDADEYGNLEVNFVKSWGVPREQVVEENRQLWTPNAPLWMVATFAILLIAVWSHFGIAIYNLIQLKKLGND